MQPLGAFEEDETIDRPIRKRTVRYFGGIGCWTIQPWERNESFPIENRNR
jgi:hypothetical protein